MTGIQLLLTINPGCVTTGYKQKETDMVFAFLLHLTLDTAGAFVSIIGTVVGIGFQWADYLKSHNRGKKKPRRRRKRKK